MFEAFACKIKKESFARADLFDAEGSHWVKLGGALCRDPGCSEGDQGQDDWDGDEDERVPGFDSIEEAGDEAREAEGSCCAYEDANNGEGHALADNEVADCGAVGPEGHADAHLLRALLHRVGHEAIDANSGEDERAGSEDSEKEHVEVLARGGADDDFIHSADVGAMGWTSISQAIAGG